MPSSSARRITSASQLGDDDQSPAGGVHPIYFAGRQHRAGADQAGGAMRLRQQLDGVEGLRGIERHFDGSEAAANQRGTHFGRARGRESAQDGDQFGGYRS